MWKRFITITLISAIFSTSSVHAAGLEALFAGFEKGCDMNPRFFTFHESLVRENRQTRSGVSYYKPGNPHLPKGIEGSLGRMSLKNMDDFTLATLPLQGKFYGLPVIRYDAGFGNRSGVKFVHLIIDAPTSKVRNVFKQKRLRISSVDSYAATLKSEGRRTKLICDWSM
ncbi:MAG TPA: hypothetical protein V6D15_09595 [Oculatellaceae cyanobacterium]|jgi:hypothetical protein